MPTRLFTVEEANRLLQHVAPIVERAQRVLSEMRWTRDQLVDLRIIWGDRLLDPSCPDRAEYEGHRAKFQELEGRLQTVVTEAARLGCEVKDVENGLVDFTASRGEELVYLCWRKGEKRIEWWHPLQGGFAARQPLETL